MSNTEVLVFLDLDYEIIRIGTLCFSEKQGKQKASFSYDKKWLAHPEKFAIEPALKLSQETFYTQGKMHLFGAIADSAPDCWGRVLMRRAEILRTKKAKSTPRTLTEKDYLLRVNDESRQGALRFSFTGQDFLTQGENAIPALVSLPRLLSAAQNCMEDTQSNEDLNVLLAPGSSLGGARPKASVYDKEGNLFIAKFPQKNDEQNTILWEAVALTLAQKAGINVVSWQIAFVHKKHVLLVKRFDRDKKRRIPFLSAMSMLGAQDNEEHSYLEIAEAISRYGSSPEKDLEELWRRIVFSILISNTDDHLRNHGFLYERQKGWRLSCAYDINPTPITIKERMLTTNINFQDNSASLDLAISVAKDFRLSLKQAKTIAGEVSRAVHDWKKTALQIGLSLKECDQMASAFEHEEKKVAFYLK